MKACKEGWERGGACQKVFMFIGPRVVYPIPGPGTLRPPGGGGGAFYPRTHQY